MYYICIIFIGMNSKAIGSARDIDPRESCRREPSAAAATTRFAVYYSYFAITFRSEFRAMQDYRRSGTIEEGF